MNLPDNFLHSFPGLVFIYTFELDGRCAIPYANKTLKDLFDISPEQVHKDASIFWTRLNFDQQETIKIELECAIKENKYWENTFQINTPSAGKTWVLAQVTPATIHKQHHTGHGLIIDISHHKQTSDKLISDANKMLTMLDIFPDLFYFKDRQSRFLGGNKAWLKGKGVKHLKDIIGLTDADLDFYAKGEGQKLFEKEQIQMAKGVTEHFREEHIGDDGEKYYYDSIKAPLIDEKGDVQGLAGLTRVITQQVKVEQELVKAKIAAEAANVAKSTFLAVMSHELRTPMNGVIGCASLLIETDMPEAQKQLIKTIHSCGESLLILLNDILDYSKIEAGRIELEARPFSLRELIEQVYEIFVQNSKEKNIHLDYFITPGTPNTLIGDSLRLRQILINIIGNSLKFTNEGGITTRVDAHFIDKKERQCELIFSVTDTGEGIAKDKYNRLFQAFSQADSSVTRTHGGTGLGLVICKKLVELMHGKIWFESKQGVGTTFYFTVSYPYSEKTIYRISEINITELNGLHALIVDDNTINGNILSETLAQWGMDSKVLSTPLKALKHLESKHHYDIALLDFCMPDIDGLSLAKILKNREHTKNLPIILLSSSMEYNNSENIDISLKKPVQISELACALAEIFDIHISSIEQQKEKVTVTSAIDHSDIRILLVEDNTVNQMVATMILKRLGYSNVTVVEDGDVAVCAVKENTYDLIFMDLQMKRMDGFTATKLIRQYCNNPTAPWIIALTAGAMESDNKDAFKAGMNQFTTKPLQIAQLKEALDKALSEIKNNTTHTNSDKKPKTL